MKRPVYDLRVQTAVEATADPLIEENSFRVEITKRAHFLQQGREVLSGPDSELADRPRVYLGARAEPPGQTPQA